ncbi:MAG: c-type cytochrome domain-containing protein [Planctomycetaceae bacterium]
MRRLTVMVMLCLTASNAGLAATEGEIGPDYTREVAPLLRKYCSGCHTGGDADGKLSVDTFADLMKGGEHGAAVLAGDAEASRLIRVLTGQAKPQMPPEGEPVPTAAEVAVLKAWVAAGAAGPNGEEPDRMALLVPDIASQTDTRPITSIDVSPDGRLLAVARYETVMLLAVNPLPMSGEVPVEGLRSLGPLPGKVTAVHFSADGSKLVAASGVTGLGGVASMWNVADGKRLRQFNGHRDVMYDAEVSADGTVLATCSYDREIMLWNAQSGELLRTLSGHNGAVYDVAFSPDGQFLASASADDTCKVWRVSDGERMDTLGQPLKEQYSVTFSPDGKFIVAAGADNRIRVWRFLSRAKPRINPLVYARFAHEGAVLQVRYTPDGRRLVSVAEDRVAKVWETKTFTELSLQNITATAEALALVDDHRYLLGGMDGRLLSMPLPAARPAVDVEASAPVAAPPMNSDPMHSISEVEPNDDPGTAQRVETPTQISGVIAGRNGVRADQDEFRLACHAGEEWVLEVNAARMKSPLDSIVEVLDGAGQPVKRLLLQAMRDSYFTFRGKNADETGDFRVFNWEEMEVNEYLYANGEVVKLFMYPRGPDSGFNVYPATGKRYSYFDTTPLSHALGEPCYIVEPHSPGSEIIPNGLPVFPVYFENDDESTRKLGTDSKLYFTAPADGEYVVRIRDVRGLEGEDFRYQLAIRPREPDFRVTIATKDLSVPIGGTKEFRVDLDRLDGFDGEVTVDIAGLPPGFTASTPIVIQAGQIRAFGTLSCDAAAPATNDGNQLVSMTSATAIINGDEVTHPGQGFGKLTRGDEAKADGRIVAAKKGTQPVATPENGPLEFEIEPGETIMLQVQVDRPDGKGEVSFGKEDSGRNLPHGIYVDNIGLNGLLLLEGESERDFFITADKWVPEQSRLFHLQTASNGGFATQPVLLHVRKKETATAR